MSRASELRWQFVRAIVPEGSSEAEGLGDLFLELVLVPMVVVCCFTCIRMVFVVIFVAYLPSP